MLQDGSCVANRNERRAASVEFLNNLSISTVPFLQKNDTLLLDVSFKFRKKKEINRESRSKKILPHREPCQDSSRKSRALIILDTRARRELACGVIISQCDIIILKDRTRKSKVLTNLERFRRFGAHDGAAIHFVVRLCGPLPIIFCANSQVLQVLQHSVNYRAERRNGNGHAVLRSSNFLLERDRHSDVTVVPVTRISKEKAEKKKVPRDRYRTGHSVKYQKAGTTPKGSTNCTSPVSRRRELELELLLLLADDNAIRCVSVDALRERNDDGRVYKRVIRIRIYICIFMCIYTYISISLCRLFSACRERKRAESTRPLATKSNCRLNCAHRAKL